MRVITRVVDIRDDTEKYYTIRIATTITWSPVNVMIHVSPCCGYPVFLLSP